MTKIFALSIVALFVASNANAEGLNLRAAMESATKSDTVLSTPTPVASSTTTVTVAPSLRAHQPEVTLKVTVATDGKKVGYAMVPVEVAPAKQHKSRLVLR
jgi:hypothetical protein